MASAEPVAFPFHLLYRWLRPVLIVAALVAAVVVGLQIFVSLYTSSAWYASIGQHDVFVRRFRTQLVLVLIVGGASALALLLSGLLAYRCSIPAMTPAQGAWALRYRRYWHRRRRLLLVLAAVITFLVAGLGAAGHWQQWLAWRNAASFGRNDAQFHRDASYFVFTYPLERFGVNTAVNVMEIALVTALVVAILCGVLRRQGRHLPAGMVGLFSALFGLLYVVKAGAYWLDRFGLVTSHRGVVTAVSYTDTHAVLPAKLALLALALLAALVLFANAWLRRGWVLVLSVGGMIVAGIVAGGIYPAIVQQVSAKPNAQSAEQAPIARNIAATRWAFGLDGGASRTASLSSLQSTRPAGAVAAALQARILDPNQVPPTFTQLQQERSIYGFKSTLDVDHYPINGTDRAVVIGAREVTIGSLPSAQRTWANQHLVYTHGYGVVAAPLDTVDAQGEPAFVESDLPPRGVLGPYQPRIYFGQRSPAYSIVDGPGSTGRGRELDLPAVGGTGQQTTTTYRGGGGVPIGSLLRQFAYAWKFRDANILLSSQVGSGSRLLYVRDPRARVAAVAPWLTLDSDAYPVVAGGHVVWVVDGYTTSNNYPESQQQNFRTATTNTFTTNGALSPQSGQVNYIRNSVKATVDAYTGAVTLYAWDQAAQPDPILRTWERAFPGLVQPQSRIPAELLPHLRYPQDLFNVQRQVLTRYHVSQPGAFYNGSDFWKVPTDPTVPGHPLQPSYYTTYDDGSGPSYALTTSFTTLNRRNLAAYMSVDAQPGPDYGRITVLEAPVTNTAEGPGQIQNDIESDPQVAQQLTLLRGGGSKVVLGNLQSVPINGQLLYVEPIYERAAGGTSFPILRRVVVVYGHRIAYDATLSAALKAVFGSA
ncbi:MAG TPA: UPF0182 family protein [Mycobacteriales bacterium]|nr:UPF0182 family protein [Mycobacteriales bacterium]